MVGDARGWLTGIRSPIGSEYGQDATQRGGSLVQPCASALIKGLSASPEGLLARELL